MKFTRLHLFGAIGVGVIALGGAGALFGYRYYVIREVKREAAKLGVTIDAIDDFHLKRDAIELDGVRFSFDGVPGSSGTAKIIEAGIERPPKKATLRGVDVQFKGRAGVWITAMSKWSREHADVFALSLTASEVKVSAREDDGDAPWLVLGAATFSTQKKDLRIEAKEAEIIGMKAAPLTLSWAADGSRASISIAGDTATPLLRADVVPTADGAQIDATLAPTTVSEFATRLHLDLSSMAKVTAHTNISVHGSGAFEGNATASVDGWIPAHPKELDGILYGKKTQATVTFKTSDDRANVVLAPVRVQVGALDLRGSGTIARGGERLGHLRVDLQGSLPCSQVVRSAAADMGGIVGGVVGLLGEHAATGNVAIHVRAEGELAELRKIAITHDEKSGCSLGF